MIYIDYDSEDKYILIPKTKGENMAIPTYYTKQQIDALLEQKANAYLDMDLWSFESGEHSYNTEAELLAALGITEAQKEALFGGQYAYIRAAQSEQIFVLMAATIMGSLLTLGFWQVDFANLKITVD